MSAGEPATSSYVFREFEWPTEEPGARGHRLCAGSSGRERIRMACALEGGAFAPRDDAPRDEIVVLAYNVERGYRTEAQIEMLLSDPVIPSPDVILMSEADRGCSRTGFRNVARAWARALGMNYVFGVEFMELPRCDGGGRRITATCEHGNAILSRYPLGNARLIRHSVNKSWYNAALRLLRLGQPRLGGRMALAADVRIGQRYLHLYSVHFESRDGPYRTAQAAEVADDGLRHPFGVIAGGDMNAAGYLVDLLHGTGQDACTQAFLSRGYADAHAGLPPAGRVTTRSGLAIDLIFGTARFTGAGIGDAGRWGGLSDHLPVWSRVRLR